MAAAGFTVVYGFTYRGALEEWSQQYHIADSWDDDADREATGDAFAAAVAPCLPASVAVRRFYFYDDTDHDSTLTYDLVPGGHTVPGTMTISSGNFQAPGDAAVWTRWKTTRTSSSGKPIYLRKYFHGAVVEGSGFQDTVYPTQVSTLTTFAADAVSTGWHSHLLAGPDGTTPTGPSAVSAFVTTRTLKRRGSRP